MDALTLTATSFIIAISLMITGREDKVETSFIGLCLAIFVSQAGFFLHRFFAQDFWENAGYAGLLAVAPFAFRFFRYLTHNRSILTRGVVVFTFITSILGSYFIFTPFGPLPYFHISVVAYVYAALGICYFAIMRYVNKLSPGVEKNVCAICFLPVPLPSSCAAWIFFNISALIFRRSPALFYRPCFISYC
jgi:hypothetical protein